MPTFFVVVIKGAILCKDSRAQKKKKNKQTSRFHSEG